MAISVILLLELVLQNSGIGPSLTNYYALHYIIKLMLLLVCMIPKNHYVLEKKNHTIVFIKVRHLLKLAVYSHPPPA